MSTASNNGTGSPYLGSKISLVSKAKIRYEGILYTIDANESTVALAKVRSYGTENRPTERPVPAREEIFEYIIFRGADIEDLQVCEAPQAPVTQDPAIVRSSEPTYSRGAASSQQNSTNALASALQTTTGSSQPSVNQSKTLKGTDSLQSTLRNMNINQQPSRPFSQQSPAAGFLDGQEYGQQTNGYGQQRRRITDYNNGGEQSTSYRRNNNYNNYQNQEWSPRNNGGGYNNNWDQNNQNGVYRNQQQRYPRQMYQNDGGVGNNRPYGQRRYNNAQGGGQNYYNQNGGQQQQYSSRQRRNSTGGIPVDTHEGTSANQQQQQQQRTRQPPQQRERANSTRGSRSALKFTGDFDFEQSNAQFNKNAITEELKKTLSIKPGKKDATSDAKTSPTTNDPVLTTTTTNIPQSENDTNKQSQQQQLSSLQSELLQDGLIDTTGFYDKAKSFFDRISCEATEKDRTNARRNWTEERRINAETFGLPFRAPQSQQQQQQQGAGGGYNQRGGYYNRGGYGRGMMDYAFQGRGYQQQQRGNYYPRNGGGGGYHQQQFGGARMYYNNNNRMRAY